MDLSVIIPCYNTGNFIKRMLDSLHEQELGDYKVESIFVMNNCTDDTEQIVRTHRLKTTILQCTEQGCGLARNVGMENCSGKYIWFMDSDDWLLYTDAIQTVIREMELGQHKMLRIPFKSTFTGHFSMVWQYCFRKDFIDDLRFRKIQPAEDNEFTNECLNRLGLNWNQYLDLPCLTTPLYYYNYMREGSNMFRYSNGEDINQ